MNEPSFWAVHGIMFILCLALMPRLTLFICSVFLGTIASGGFLWWLGWLFVPRLLIAILATYGYWDTNPILVVLTWMWALSGEKEEKSSSNNSERSQKVGIFSLVHVTTLIPRILINDLRLWLLRINAGINRKVQALKNRKQKDKETANFGGQLTINLGQCPYCHDQVSGKDEKHGCEKCGAWHHLECWNDHRGCATSCGNRRV